VCRQFEYGQADDFETMQPSFPQLRGPFGFTSTGRAFTVRVKGTTAFSAITKRRCLC
jgi:hypothetical protein